MPEKEEEITETWLAYLNPTLISCRYGTTAAEFGLVGYFPNLV
ncbi:CAP-Gly domain-containing linker protein 1-like, partial [Trifolium medium]|nr:CAP-Gly domain-containing linker protein 1-like [Trifolium medium]